MILVSEAGWRSASGLVACRTVPELASTTIAAKAGLYALPEFLLRALASSLESATKAPTVTSEKKPQRSPRGAPLHIHDMQDFPRPPIPASALPEHTSLFLCLCGAKEGAKSGDFRTEGAPLAEPIQPATSTSKRKTAGSNRADRHHNSTHAGTLGEVPGQSVKRHAADECWARAKGSVISIRARVAAARI